MNARTRLGALLGAASLVFAIASVAFAAPPTYTISVDKQANPTSVPPSGGTVTFTVSVQATGSGHFLAVAVSDSLAGCTVTGPTGDTGSDGKLEPGGETWVYSCTVNNVTPGTTNVATVNACHSAGVCNNASHDAQGTDSVTLTEGAEPSVAPSGLR